LAAGQDNVRSLLFDGTYLWVALATIPAVVFKIYIYLRKVDSFPKVALNQTASRALGGVVTNNSSVRSMLVIVSARCSTGAGAGSATIQAFADTISPPVTAQSGIIGLNANPVLGEDNTFQISFIVHPLYKFMVTATTTGTGAVVLDAWFETFL